MKDEQRMSVGTLLDFLLVYSANDAAHVAALAVSKTEDEFIQLMNDKAISLKMYETNFTNVHGLDEEEHFTTLDDLLKLTLEAIRYDEIIVSTNKEYFYSDVIDNNIPNGEQNWPAEADNYIAQQPSGQGWCTGISDSKMVPQNTNVFASEFDNTISGGKSSTTAMEGSTESEQF